jgi:hypothetical protein
LQKVTPVCGGRSSFLLLAKREPTSDVTLAAPPAGQGFQVVLGPFDVPTGEEVQRNYYQKLPVDSDVYVTKIEFKYNKGSHHFNIFKSDSIDHADGFEDTFTAVGWESWDMVAASQQEAFTWELPPGVAIHLKAHQQMDFQTHFVNAGTQVTPSGHGKVIVNFWTTDKSKITTLGGSVFANNKALNIQPHTSATYCKVLLPFDHDIQLLLLTGHYHSRGKNFVVGHWDGTKLIDTIYTNKTWDEPPVLRFNTPLTLHAGDSLAFITTFENRTDQLIKFGPHVENEEHANLFLFYYPGPENSRARYDFDHGFLMESHPL